jgi:hypothetical protein
LTTTELDSIEEALGWPLPDHYRRFTLRYRPSLVQVKPKGFPPITEWEFANNPRRVILWNLHVRRQKAGTYVDGPWPDKYLVIGAEPGAVGSELGGNYYVIDRHVTAETVFLWLHDTGEFYSEAESLPEFVDWLIDYFWQFKDDDEKEQTDKVAALIHREMAEVKEEASGRSRQAKPPKSKKPSRRKRGK